MQTVITTEVGDSPAGSDKENQLTIISTLGSKPKNTGDDAEGLIAEEMVDWLFRYIPYTLYLKIRRAITEKVIGIT